MNQYNENSNHLLNNFIAHYVKSSLAKEGQVATKDFESLCDNSHILCQYHIEFIRLLDLNIDVNFFFKNFF